MDENAQTSQMLALLAWWRDTGVSDALEEPAIDWTTRPDSAPGADFVWPGTAGRSDAKTRAPIDAGRPSPVVRPDRPSPSPPTTTTTGRGAPAPSGIGPTASPGGPSTAAPAQRRLPPAVTAARQAARSAASLEALEALLNNFDGCPLKATAKSLCFYRGSPTARVMVIGEAPGRDEDLAGKPFVGRGGQLLDRMLGAIGLAEADVHITNIVYWRPPGNRPPTPEEAQACRPFLDRQIELVEPQYLLTLGGPAAKAILDANEGILKLRGRWHGVQSGGRTIPVMPTLHPAYLLRQPEAKRQAWRDLMAFKAKLDGISQGESL